MTVTAYRCTDNQNHDSQPRLPEVSNSHKQPPTYGFNEVQLSLDQKDIVYSDKRQTLFAKIISIS